MRRIEVLENTRSSQKGRWKNVLDLDMLGVDTYNQVKARHVQTKKRLNIVKKDTLKKKHATVKKETLKQKKGTL